MIKQSGSVAFHSFFIKLWNIMIEKQNLIKYNRNNGLIGRPLRILKDVCMEKANAKRRFFITV